MSGSRGLLPVATDVQRVLAEELDRLDVRRLAVTTLARALRTVPNGVIAVKSCNQGFWRADLETVNGFDEAMIGWGSEDKELCARLENTGIRRQTLVFAALAWHLSHAPAPRHDAAANRARWAETVRTGRKRCEAGLDAHSTT